ncbi:MAG: VanZ family protein [Desulfovibrionaceae bacterium]|nr:VanZ family protein [Desulfovibrionaceae bacterium]
MPLSHPDSARTYRALLAFWIAGTLLLVALSLVPMPVNLNAVLLLGVAPLDKALHAAFFALLTALPVLLFRSGLRAALSVAALMILGVTTEYLQLFNATRTSSIDDAAANLVGGCAGLACALTLRCIARGRFPLQAGGRNAGRDAPPESRAR